MTNRIRDTGTATTGGFNDKKYIYNLTKRAANQLRSPEMACIIPTVDLSPFFTEDNQDGKKKAMELITEACSQFGFFQIVNHGIPLKLLSQVIEQSQTFFGYSDDEKLKSGRRLDAPLAPGYNRLPEHAPDMNEFLVTFPPGSGLNIYPQNPPGFKEVLQETFSYMTKTGLLIETILNESLGLPPNLLKEYNNDRSCDFMINVHYFPSTEGDKFGLTEHEDGNVVTFVFQDDVGGLEVNIDGEWVPIAPAQDKITVNVGDSIQVLSNNKFRSSTHRVARPKEKDRYSYAFFYNLQGDKWVEPLPQFTKEIGEPPKYRGFFYKEYQAIRMRNKTHPPTKPEDLIRINYYAITD